MMDRQHFLDLAEAEAEAELAPQDLKGMMGYCHVVWQTQKRILKEKYGIDWKTPAEENPHIDFD